MGIHSQPTHHTAVQRSDLVASDCELVPPRTGYEIACAENGSLVSSYRVSQQPSSTHLRL